MTRRGGFLALLGSLAVFAACAALVAWRLVGEHATPAAPPPISPPRVPPVLAAQEAAAAKAAGPVKISTIIDLPGDPVLVARGVATAPRELTVDLPSRLGPAAAKVESPAYFVGATLLSTDGGYMGKFPEGGEEADALAAQLAFNAAQMADGGDNAAQAAAGLDDDGGDLTPVDAQDLMLSDANSNSLDVTAGGANGAPQLKQTVLRTLAPERIADLLIANGFAEESARAVEAAAKERYNVQTLPPRSLALAVGALDATGAYRVAELAIYEDNDYVGAIALAENGLYGEGAQPSLPADFFDNGAKAVDAATHFDIADGVYSAGLRNGVPEPVIREAIQLMGRLTDLKAALPADEAMRFLYARNFRGKSKLIGKLIYLGLSGGAGAVDVLCVRSRRRIVPLFRRQGLVGPAGPDRKRRDERRRHPRADQGRADHVAVRHALSSDPAHPQVARRHRLRRGDRQPGSRRRRRQDRDRRTGLRIRKSHPRQTRRLRDLLFPPLGNSRGDQARRRRQGGRDHRALRQHRTVDRPASPFRVLSQRVGGRPAAASGNRSPGRGGRRRGADDQRRRRSGGGGAPASAEEIAAFPAAKALVDAALEAATK